MSQGRAKCQAFTLIEVVLAMAVVSGALLAVIALVPFGVANDRISLNETRALYILSTVESDLRNSYPANGKSLVYELPTPYALTAVGALTTNTALPAVGTVTPNVTSIALDDTESRTELTAARQPFQVTVIYTRNWAGTLAPAEASLIVNWPSLNTSDPKQLTSSQVSGYVQAYVTFSAP